MNKPDFDIINNYLLNRLHAAYWAECSLDDREKSVALAWLILDGSYQWKSEAKTITPTGIAWHHRVIAAVGEQALFLLQNETAVDSESTTAGVTSLSVAGYSVSFEKGGSNDNAYSLICPMVPALLGDLAVVHGGSVQAQYGTISSSLLGG